MRLVRNAGNDRVIEPVRPWLKPGSRLDVVTPTLSLFAFAEMLRDLAATAQCRFLLPPEGSEPAIFGSEADRATRNRLQARWLATRFAEWLLSDTEIRRALGPIPRGAFVLRDNDARPQQVLLGSLSFSTDGLGLTPGNPLSLIQASEGKANTAAGGTESGIEARGGSPSRRPRQAMRNEDTMKKLTSSDPETHSADIVAENVKQLKALFPEAVTEGKIDFDVLKQLLGGTVEEREEKYGLNWHGKRRARQLALTPSTGTLRPCPEDSVDWDTTQNLMIEGDNLEVLKLLQKSYAGKVKLIYIDPPYNTGKDFVYPDNFQDNIKNYLQLTGQVEGGAKISSNTEASGRFHTDWLNMMYARLRGCRQLLSQEGAIFVSCDDAENANLRLALDDVFGPENFIAQFVWRSRQFTDARAVTNVSTDHEYVLCYARDSGFSVRGVERDESKFSNPDNDPRGPWMSRSLLGLATRDQRPNLHYDLVEPGTGRSFPPNSATGWRYSPEKMQALMQDDCILFPTKDAGRPREKKFRKDMNSEFIAFRSIIEGTYTADGTQEIRELFGAEVFGFPKPTKLLQQIIAQVSRASEIVLDFFAGSGSTGHAVVAQNAVDNATRRYILVQLPEPLSVDDKDQKLAADFCDKQRKPRNIAELTKERLRRAAKKIKDENPMFPGDLGFRVFKLDSSNIRAWEPNRADLDGTLQMSIEHLKADRSEVDILYELLLKLGLDLCVPIGKRTLAGKDVHAIGGGVLLACLADKITREEVEPLTQGIVEWHKLLAPAGDTTCVFRDSAFADDVAKTNLAAIPQQHGLQSVRSL